MIIEFLALPATGKSYIAKATIGTLKEYGISAQLTNEKVYLTNSRIWWRLRKILLIFKLITRDIYVWRLIWNILIEDVNFLNKIGTLYNTLSLISVNRVNNNSQIVIRDEGLYQMLFALNLFGHKDIVENNKILKRLIYAPDLVILLKGKDDILTNLKLQNKGGRIFKNLTSGKIQTSQTVESMNVVETFMMNQCVNFIPVDYDKNISSLNHTVKLIVKKIKECGVKDEKNT